MVFGCGEERVCVRAFNPSPSLLFALVSSLVAGMPFVLMGQEKHTSKEKAHVLMLLELGVSVRHHRTLES